MSDFKEKLVAHLRTFSTNPYLFVGSGLSRRYYNLPTWLQLLRDFYPNLHNTTDFNYYLTKSNRDPARLASLMAQEFHEIWWKHDSFAKSRKVFGENVMTQDHPFKYEIAEFIKKNGKENTDLKDEISLFGKVVVDGIITTNWDVFLEKAFKDFKPYIGQQQLLFAESISIGEIFKIHGCCSKSDSLVLTEEDYQNFNSRNAYLAAKLLTIFVEHPIIFLGYSISDPNINDIISSIVQCLDSNNIDRLKDRLLFVEWKSDQLEPLFEDGRLFQSGKNPLPIKHLKLSSFTPLYEVLSSLERRYPVKVLQRLKESVVEIVKTNKATKHVYVGDLDDLGDNSQVEFVIGVGAAQNALRDRGYVGIDANDLIEDVVFDNRNFDSRIIMDTVLPKIAKWKTFLPICKYLRALGYYTKSGLLSAAAQAELKEKKIFYRGESMPSCFLPASSYVNHKSSVNAKYKNISMLIEDNGEDNLHKLFYIPLLDKRKIDLDALQQFLQHYMKGGEEKNTHFRKVVCLFDYYKNTLQLS